MKLLQKTMEKPFPGGAWYPDTLVQDSQGGFPAVPRPCLMLPSISLLVEDPETEIVNIDFLISCLRSSFISP